METWEMIKKLTENPRKKFKNHYGKVVKLGRFGDLKTLVWSHNNQPVTITNYLLEHKWEEVKEAVTWEEAFKAGLEGKKIKPKGQTLTFPDYKSLDYVIPYLAERPSYYKKIMLDEWYIED